MHEHFRMKNGIQVTCRSVLSTALLACGICSVAGAATICVNPSGKSGCQTTISAAVAMASAGDTIQVAPGTYKEMVTITKPLSVIALNSTRPIIEAKGLSNGILISGVSMAPDPGVADVLVSGLEVRDANFEGILVMNATDVTLFNNKVMDNDTALDIGNGACPGIPAFETNEGDDCGEGIHLMGVDHSSILDNESEHNSGGILISDETGTSTHNVIKGNNVHDNVYDCGITLASHGPAVTVIPAATISFGVTDNVIAHNTSARNGIQLPGAGAGVGIFAPFPGTAASGNVVVDNDIMDNGQPGVTMHNHAWAPSPAPPVHFNDNVIVGNRISGNGKDTGDAATPGMTGINVFSKAPILGTIIEQNTFDDEQVNVAFNAPSGQLNVHYNNFVAGIGVDNIGMGTVNATENWWHCMAGPINSKCASVMGSGVSYMPFAASKWDLDNLW